MFEQALRRLLESEAGAFVKGSLFFKFKGIIRGRAVSV